MPVDIASFLLGAGVGLVISALVLVRDRGPAPASDRGPAPVSEAVMRELRRAVAINAQLTTMAESQNALLHKQQAIMHQQDELLRKAGIVHLTKA